MASPQDLIAQIDELFNGGIPFFDSAERAVQTYALAVQYFNWIGNRRPDLNSSYRRRNDTV